MGWPNLAEIYKNLKVYENVCDFNLTSTSIVNGTVNCPERDALFTYVYFMSGRQICSRQNKFSKVST